MNSIQLTLPIASIEVIMQALIKLPYEQVATIIASIDEQVRPQIEAKNA